LLLHGDSTNVFNGTHRINHSAERFIFDQADRSKAMYNIPEASMISITLKRRDRNINKKERQKEKKGG
jgi:hypothetical protein